MKKVYLANNIKFKRSQLNMSQKELAGLIGKKSSVISAYEKGTAQPNIDTLIKIASIFEIGIELLITEDIANSNTNILNQKSFVANSINTLSEEKLNEWIKAGRLKISYLYQRIVDIMVLQNHRDSETIEMNYEDDKWYRKVLDKYTSDHRRYYEIESKLDIVDKDYKFIDESAKQDITYKMNLHEKENYYAELLKIIELFEDKFFKEFKTYYRHVKNEINEEVLKDL